MEGALDNRGPLQATDNKCVGSWALRLHELAFYNAKEREPTLDKPKAPTTKHVQAKLLKV